MEDTANKRETVIKIAKALDDMKGNDTIVLDVSEKSGWTDYFIITTVNSASHLRGIYKNIMQVFSDSGVQTYRKHKNIENENWVLIDCGYFIIHLMDRQHRDFYELEKLWFSSSILYHSSKSS